MDTNTYIQNRHMYIRTYVHTYLNGLGPLDSASITYIHTYVHIVHMVHTYISTLRTYVHTGVFMYVQNICENDTVHITYVHKYCTSTPTHTCKFSVGILRSDKHNVDIHTYVHTHTMCESKQFHASITKYTR